MNQKESGRSAASLLCVRMANQLDWNPSPPNDGIYGYRAGYTWVCRLWRNKKIIKNGTHHRILWYNQEAYFRVFMYELHVIVVSFVMLYIIKLIFWRLKGSATKKKLLVIHLQVDGQDLADNSTSKKLAGLLELFCCLEK